MKINSVTAKALARKVELQLHENRELEMKKAEKDFKKTKAFKHFHQIQDKIKTLTEQKCQIVKEFDGADLDDNHMLKASYDGTTLLIERKNKRYHYREDIAADILAKAAFVDSDISLEDFIKELIEEYK